MRTGGTGEGQENNRKESTEGLPVISITNARKESLNYTMMAKHGILLVVLVAAGSLLGAVDMITARDTIVLEYVAPVDAPLVNDGAVRQKIDLVFDRCPEEYWIFYNEKTQRLIVEFFGIHVTAARDQIKGTPILSDLKVLNYETRSSLNGKAAQVSMLMKRGWHYRTWIVGEKVLRIQLWIPLDAQRASQTNRKTSRLPVVIISAALLSITAGVLLGLLN